MKTAKKNINIFASSILTIGIIVLLIMAGPASAIRLDINGLDNVAENSTESFTVSVDIEENENVPVQNLTLTIGDKTCTFSLAGQNITGTLCQYLTITKNYAVGYNDSASGQFGYGYGYDATNASWAYRNYTFSTGYGYGYTYGYGYSAYPYGELSYNITFDPWAVTSDTTYAVSFQADIAGGNKYKVASDSSITITNVASTGGGTTGGDGTSGGAAPAGDDQDVDNQQEGVVVDNNLVTNLLDTIDPMDLGLTALDAENVKVTLADTQTKRESLSEGVLQEALAAAVTPEAQTVIQSIIDAVAQGQSGRVEVVQTTEVYEVKNEGNDRSVYRTKVTLKLVAPESTEEMTIVHVIPKDVAADVQEVLFTGALPEILQADPIVQWTFTDVSKGDEYDISYIVKGQKDTVQAKSTAAYKVAAEEPAAVEPEPESEPVEDAQGSNAIWWIVLLVAVVIAIGIWVRRKQKA